MNASVTLDGGRIVVRSTFDYAKACKESPTREWNPASKSWRFDATPWAAHRLCLALEAVGGRVEISDEVSRIRAAAIPVASIIDSITLSLGDDEIPKDPRSRFRPWLHQFIGASLIRSLSSVYLAWEMGTGKTKGTIDAIASLARPGVFLPVLIVAPASVVDVWAQEFPKHLEDLSGFEIVATRSKDTVAKRTDKAREAYERAKAAGSVVVVVTNYEAFALDSSKLLAWAASVLWEILVADEAHRLSTPGAKTTRALTSKISPRARRIVFLSGTPMRNSPLDLYSQCKILDAGIFGSNQRQFLERYATLDFFGNVVGLQNTDELAATFGVVAHRVDKRRVLDLPPVTVQSRRFDLSPEARKVYDEFEDKLAIQIGDGTLDAANSLVHLLRLQQITGGYVPVETAGGGEVIHKVDDGKAKALAEFADEIAKSEPIVVFARFRKDLDTIAEVAAADGRTSFELSGRRNELREWQADTGGAVLAVQIQAGGVGVDLTRAAFGGFYSVGFSLSEYEQAMARLDRPGQTRPVTLVNFIARDTVDEAVFGSIAKKGKTVEDVIDTIRRNRA